MVLIVSHKITPVQVSILERLLSEHQLQGQVLDLAYQKIESIDLSQVSLLVGIGIEVVATVLTLTEGRPLLPVKLIPDPIHQVVGLAYNLDLFLVTKPSRLALMSALEAYRPLLPEEAEIKEPLRLEVDNGTVNCTPDCPELEQQVVRICETRGFCQLYLRDLPMVVYQHRPDNLRGIKLEFPLEQFISFLQLAQDPDIKLLSVKDRLGARHRLS